MRETSISLFWAVPRPMPMAVTSARGGTHAGVCLVKVASGTSAPAAMREASGTTSWTSPAPAARAPSPAMTGAWM